jgi:AbrB family looped-hinge helix DNA binding protein
LEAYTVGSKGQVVIAKEIRDRLGIEPGWTAIEEVVGDHVEIYFLPPPHDRSLAGMLAPYIKRRIGDLDWNDVREAAWGKAWREKMVALEDDNG